MTLIPAYGRDYTSAYKVLEDWSADKDFIVSESGQYINRADFERYHPRDERVYIRYNRLRSKLIVGD